MNTLTDWLRRSRDWMDERGTPAWIVAIVLGFAAFPPLGLVLLFYTLWSKRMSCNSWKRRARHERRLGYDKTGNTAFDTYRAETLRRLEDERAAFTGFLDQLRAAKDQAEFDQFMAGRQQSA